MGTRSRQPRASRCSATLPRSRRVRHFFRRLVGGFEHWDYEVEESIDAGDAVVLHLHHSGRGKESGAPVEARFWQVWTMRDGKVVRVTHHVEKAEALEAAGLRE